MYVCVRACAHMFMCVCVQYDLGQGSPTLFLESYRPVGYLAYLIIIISWLISCIRLVTTGVGVKTYYQVALQEHS